MIVAEYSGVLKESTMSVNATARGVTTAATQTEMMMCCQLILVFWLAPESSLDAPMVSSVLSRL